MLIPYSRAAFSRPLFSGIIEILKSIRISTGGKISYVAVKGYKHRLGVLGFLGILKGEGIPGIWVKPIWDKPLFVGEVLKRGEWDGESIKKEIEFTGTVTKRVG